ncbi:uncharacterized protein LOC111195954 isoform X2 [Astyanax mexicanus]|uniref:uncharacterized protein LOC111195954 isoform X2 n=1 Tax=Astyanax mexicanus TaxID=7994 RepID=UPI000BBDCDD5|nr:uncharacterized protein LOC111195954 isoform X2 [Astyanax mexicanus]
MFPKKTYLRYVVVHFFDEDEVEAAPSLWIEWCDGIVMLWPDTEHERHRTHQMWKNLMLMNPERSLFHIDSEIKMTNPI